VVSQENLEIVKRGLESYLATGEVPWALFDEKVEVHDHDTPDQGDYRGHEGYARWLEDWGAAWADWSLEVEEYLDTGDWVVVFVVMRTKGRGSGIETTRQDAQLYRLRDGIVVETDYYNDREQALKAVGLGE
jgi:ketosteroid isomerase-like protein